MGRVVRQQLSDYDCRRDTYERTLSVCSPYNLKEQQLMQGSFLKNKFDQTTSNILFQRRMQKNQFELQSRLTQLSMLRNSQLTSEGRTEIMLQNLKDSRDLSSEDKEAAPVFFGSSKTPILKIEQKAKQYSRLRNHPYQRVNLKTDERQNDQSGLILSPQRANTDFIPRITTLSIDGPGGKA